MVALALAVPASSAASSSGASRGESPGRRYLQTRGYLVADPAAYARNKAEAARRAGQPVGRQAVSPHNPVALPSFEGQFESDLTPPDTTGAIGPRSYVQFVNLWMGIYDRAGGLIASAPVESLFGASHSVYSDPQVLWDPDTQRFFMLIWTRTNATMRWAFSKTSHPRSLDNSGWCVYTSTFGYNQDDAPDYPKLGQTKDFLLIGVNFFQGSQTFEGGELLTIQKPQGSQSITQCPGNTFKTHRFTRLRNADGSLTNAPEPAQQADVRSKGYVVTTADTSQVPSANFITLYRVSRNKHGDPVLGPPKSLAVPTFSAPAAAPQCMSPDTIDTLDGRFEHAVSAVDPRVGKSVIWTAHAVAGGAGSEERWYEIQYGNTPTLVQSGKATSATLYVHNGGIASDRTVNPSGVAHGQNMVMSFSTSSATQCPAIQMVSKIGANAQSAFVLVKQSSVPSGSFTCSPCRWGDYSGASPDPAAPLADPSGKVWLANQWTSGSGAVNWRTWIFGATP